MDIRTPLLENEGTNKNLIGVAATASFSLKKFEQGFSYLERLGKTDDLYVRICFMEAMLNFQKGNAKTSWDFIMHVLDVPTFSGTQRVTAVLVLGQLAQELNSVEFVVRLMDEESRRPGLREGGRKELKRVRRLLWMVGRPAKNLDHITIWLNPEGWRYDSMKNRDHVLCFFRQETLQKKGADEFIKNLRQNVNEEIGIVGLTLLKEPLDVQLYKGATDPQVDKAEIKLLKESIQQMGLQFPVGVFEEGADWLEFGVKSVPQLVFVDKTGVVQGIIWPPFSPILVSSFMKKIQPDSKGL